MTNKCIENYVLQEKLGAGQYGIVYTAKDQTNNKVVAIKVTPTQKFKSTPRLSEFTTT
jgi:serine/threonine protein kinase